MQKLQPQIAATSHLLILPLPSSTFTFLMHVYIALQHFVLYYAI